MKKITLVAGMAALVLGLSACGSGNSTSSNNGGGTNSGGNTNGGGTTVDPTVPSAATAPVISGVGLHLVANSASSLATYTDVPAKCTFTFSGSYNGTVVAIQTAEKGSYENQNYKHTANFNNGTGAFHASLTCKNTAGSTSKTIL